MTDSAFMTFLKGLGALFVTIFLSWCLYACIADSYRLSVNGKEAIATIMSYEYSTGPRGVSHHYHQMSYDSHTTRLDLGKPYGVGSQVTVVYLLNRPGKVQIGNSQSTAWELFYLKQGKYGVLSCVAMLAGFGCVTAGYFYKSFRLNTGGSSAANSDASRIGKNTTVKCKACGKLLSDAQAAYMLNDLECTEWCREGYCCLACFEQHCAGREPAIDNEQRHASFPPSDISHLIAMLCKMAKGDGIITRDEIDVIDAFFATVLKLAPDERDIAIETFGAFKKDNTPFEVHAKKFYGHHKDNNEYLETVVNLLTDIAFADGELSAEEEILLNQAIIIFGVDAPKYNKYKSSYNGRKSTDGISEKETHHAKILGLSSDVTPDNVKFAYRRLAVQYHPDKVSHLGPKLKEVAEIEMKKINEAYEFFQIKYGT